MNPRLPIGIMFGRLIRVRAHRHDPEATIYVVAEPELRKAQSSSASRVTAQNILGPEIFRGKAAWPPLGLCDGLLARGRQRLFNDEKRSERTKEHKTRAEKGAALESRAARCLPRNELGSVTPAGSIANSPNRRQAHLSPFHMRVVNAPRRIDQEPAEAAHVLNDARCRDRGGEVSFDMLVTRRSHGFEAAFGTPLRITAGTNFGWALSIGCRNSHSKGGRGAPSLSRPFLSLRHEGVTASP